MMMSSSRAMTMGNSRGLSISSIVIFFTAIACQLTDVALGPVKVWELMAISLFPFFIRRIETKLLVFLVVFVLLMLLSLFKGAASDVYFSNYGGLKSKYVISLVRFVELVLCLVVACLPFNFYRNNGLSYTDIVRKFLNYNGIILLGIFALFMVDVAAGSKLVSYGPTHRMRGFYVEGGPYGLYISTLLLLELMFLKRKLFLAMFAVALLLSQSKAGIVGAVVFGFLAMTFRYPFLRSFINPKNVFRFSTLMLVGVLLGGAVMYKVAENYVDDLSNLNEVLALRGNDPSLVMGRIAATYIGPNIISDNPYIGVGLGAYSLVRNNSEYRGPFPVVPGWDLTGLGGFFNLMIENGAIGVILFLIATIRYFKFDEMGMVFFVLFVLPFLLGAQLYMVYPWLYLGFYSVYRREMTNE